MTTNKAIKTILILFFLIFPFTVYAWDSMGDKNHRRITNDAINDLGIYDYPDLDMYKGMYLGDGVVEGSADEDAHKNPDTDIEYWEGPYYDEYWKDQAKDNYKASNFRIAYNYFGYYLHLRQDSFVPAHIKKCAHGVWRRWTDSLESFADSNHVYSPGTITAWDGYDRKGHYWKYWLADNEDDDDGNETTADVNDSSQRDGPNSYNLLSTWGTYGKGKWPKDKIPGNDKGKDWYDGSGNSAFIAYEQLYKAYIDTKAKLKEFSEKLPPLVKDLNITPSSLNCNTQSDFQISFKILENRKKTVKIFMTVDGEAIISTEYSTGKPFDLFSGTDLPWEGAYSVTWDGKLANGQYPSDGEHTLYVSVEDEDGNVSEVAQHQFSIDTGPLTITGTETITTNSSAQYTATGCPNNVEWSVTGTGATISSTGLLTVGSTACGSLTITATCVECGTSANHNVTVTGECSALTIVNEDGTPATDTMPTGSSLDFKTTGDCCESIQWSTNKGSITQAGILTANCCPCGSIQITAECPSCGTSANHNITVTGECSTLAIVNENSTPATDTILRNGSLDFKTTGDCCVAIQWSVSVDSGSGLGGSSISGAGVLTAGATSCGSLKVTASCLACGTSATQYVRVTNAGQWVQILLETWSYTGVCCVMDCVPGLGILITGKYKYEEKYMRFCKDPAQPCAPVANSPYATPPTTCSIEGCIPNCGGQTWTQYLGLKMSSRKTYEWVCQ